MAIDSKSIRKLIRRFQFARLVAYEPRHAKATYQLIRRPQKIDPLTLGGLSGSETLEQILKSTLMWTGNPHVPLQVARNLYLNNRRDAAFAVLKRTPGSDARMVEAELLLYSGDIAKAMQIFSAAADRSATRPHALRHLALGHYLKHELDAAIDTIIIAAATYPRFMPLMTLFSRIVRNRGEVDRYLQEKVRLAKHGLSANSSAQLIRACGRAGAERAKAEAIACDAIINLCAAATRRQPAPRSDKRPTTHVNGAPKGAYSSEKGNAILEHIAEVAEKASIRLFPMGGTLLGLIRDNELLPWDKDLDFGCFAEEATIPDLWEAFFESPYFLPMGVVADRLIKLRHFSGVTVDIFVNFSDGGDRWHGGQFISWRDNGFSLRDFTVRGQRFYIPSDPEAYLAHHYGQEWNIPDPHFDVLWEAPNAFDANTEHRYLNTIAKGIQFLAARSPEAIVLRQARAISGGAEDVAEAYAYVLNVYEAFRVQ